MTGARLAVACGLALWAGATLLLSELRWFARPTLVERLRPYSPGGLGRRRRRDGVLSVESFREVVRPLSRALGERVAGVFGVTEDLATRLQRIHSPLDVTAFRVRQLGMERRRLRPRRRCWPSPPARRRSWPCSSSSAGRCWRSWSSSSRSPRPPTGGSDGWSVELPVVAEQLAMLLSAGYSLGAALNRLAARGRGAAATDLTRVCARLRQGLTETEALREWAAVADVEALHRLLPVLALNRESSDLGRLLSEEARAIRRDLHRRLIETAERRGQQVWIPVTIAALLPGVVFIAIPFIEALSLFSSS